MTSRDRVRHALASWLVLAGAVLAAGSASAQVVRGELAATAGVATDQRGVRSNALTLAPSVLLSPDPRFSAVLGLTATQFGANARAIGGSGTLGARVPLGSVLALAGTASASATQTSFNATYASGDLTPTLEATVGGLTVFGGVHVASGATSLRMAGATPGNVFGAPTVTTRDTSFSRTSAGAVFGGVLNFAGASPDEAGALSYREEHAHVACVRVTDRVATGTLVSGALTLAASGGMRSAIDEQSGFGSLSASFALGRTLALQGAVGTYPSNRVTGTVAGRFASVGVVLHGLRRLDAPVPMGARVVGVPGAATGMTRLAIRAPGAHSVEVAGDWNGWLPASAARSADDVWYVDVRLPHGEYRYAFKVDGRRWTVPEGVPSVDDGFGGKSALVSVR